MICEMSEAMCGTNYQQWAIDVIKRQPTADVAEVKHGEWIDGRCTNCNYKTDIEQIGFKCWGDGVHVKYKETNFCPNCGAKMDGKEQAK